jgi:hypothetical protein
MVSRGGWLSPVFLRQIVLPIIHHHGVVSNIGIVMGFRRAQNAEACGYLRPHSKPPTEVQSKVPKPEAAVLAASTASTHEVPEKLGALD